MKNDLKELPDPQKYNDPISINDKSFDLLKRMLSAMLLIRKTEQQLALGRKNGVIGGPVHLGAGQEAIAVGISQNLKKTDRVFGAHRSHSHLLALNPDFYKLFAEVLGKETGFSKGMGGSMHLYDQPNGFYGSAPEENYFKRQLVKRDGLVHGGVCGWAGGSCSTPGTKTSHLLRFPAIPCHPLLKSTRSVAKTSQNHFEKTPGT